MAYKKKLTTFFYCLTLTATVAALPLSSSFASDHAVSLQNAVGQSLTLPRTLARAQAGGLHGIQNIDNLRFAPSFQGDVHHADGQGIPLSNTVGLDATTMTFELSQPLYRSGHSRAQAQSQDNLLRAEQAEKKLQLQSAALLIVNTFLDAQRETEQLGLMQQLNMPPQDLQNKEANLSFLRQDLQELSEVRTDANLQKVNTPALLPRSLQNALSIMEDKHPALAKAIHQCAAAEAASRSLRWGQEPNIDLRGALDRTVDNYSDTQLEDSGTIGLRATIPFLGEQESKSRRLHARETAEQGRQNIDQTRLQLRQQVIAAWDKLARAQEEITVQQHKVRLATAGAAGKLPAESALNGSTAATLNKLAERAQISEIKAKYDLRKAEFALLAATGQLLDSLNNAPIMPQWRDEDTAQNMKNMAAPRLTAVVAPEPLTP